MFTQTSNPLAEYGQAPTPPAGSQLTKIEINDDDQQGFFDRLKERYVWYPGHDVSFLGKMGHQPLSFTHLYRGRTAWVQAVSYKQVDNSPESFDQIGDEEAPLRSFICTPFAQCVYLYLNYGQKGLRVFEHLKGAQPELVALIEKVVLPEVATDLISLGKYLVEESPKNIAKAGFDHKTENLANETLASMLTGVNDAIRYYRELIAESEGEILTRKNKGWGKSHLDQNDRWAYVQTNRPIPQSETLETSSENNTNKLLEKFVEAMTEVKGNREGANDSVTTDTLNQLRKELAETQAKFAAFIAKHEAANSGGPEIEDNTVVSKEEAEKVLQQRLNNTKKK